MKNIIIKLIESELSRLDISEDIIIEVPSDLAHGNFSTNIAMKISKKIGKNPRDIATEMLNNISHPLILKVEVAGPGFLNFYLKNDYLYDNIDKIINEADNYGKSDFGNRERINIEFVSANPTGTLHLGHARGAVYGSSLANIMKFTGYDVTREFYVNDAGNQIDNLVASVCVRYKEACGIESSMPENGYYGIEIVELGKDIRVRYGNDLDCEKDKLLFKEESLKLLLGEIEKDLKNIHVNFDVWTREQSFYDNGQVADVLNRLKASDYSYSLDDAIWIKSSEFGDEKDRVIIKSDGTYTYLVPDIAYHANKYDRGYDKLIDVLGADHHGYVGRIKAAVEILGYNADKLEVKILQMVRLMRGSEEVKMSKRTGNAVTINELVEEVGVDATRYIFASRSLDSQLTFDIEQAIKKSNENPVYYVQYAHARICSILNNYDGIETAADYDTFEGNEVKMLLSKLYEFPDTVINSSANLAPHIIANYAYELASFFHSFYATEKIITEDGKYTNARINLIKAVKVVLNNSLALLGVSAPESM